jgi:hypothetical protein
MRSLRPSSPLPSTGAPTHEPGSVTAQVADGIGSVTFGYPKGNSLPAALLAELAASTEARVDTSFWIANRAD